MFEEITEILSRASRYDFRLLPLYAECQTVADETQRLLGSAVRTGKGDAPAASANIHGVTPHGESAFHRAA